jgi:hypothetical protein
MVTMTDSLNGPPTLDDQHHPVVDDRILTSCAAACARMDGWWTCAVGDSVIFARRKGLAYYIDGVDMNDRSHGSMT